MKRILLALALMFSMSSFAADTITECNNGAYYEVKDLTAILTKIISNQEKAGFKQLVTHSVSFVERTGAWKEVIVCVTSKL